MNRDDHKQRATLQTLARVRGLERQEHFKNGGTAVAWMGGPRLVQRDRRREASRRACRERIR